VSVADLSHRIRGPDDEAENRKAFLLAFLHFEVAIEANDFFILFPADALERPVTLLEAEADEFLVILIEVEVRNQAIFLHTSCHVVTEAIIAVIIVKVARADHGALLGFISADERPSHALHEELQTLYQAPA